jgi:hypothetical protein
MRSVDAPVQRSHSSLTITPGGQTFEAARQVERRRHFGNQPDQTPRLFARIRTRQILDPTAYYYGDRRYSTRREQWTYSSPRST